MLVGIQKLEERAGANSVVTAAHQNDNLGTAHFSVQRLKNRECVGSGASAARRGLGHDIPPGEKVRNDFNLKRGWFFEAHSLKPRDKLRC